MVFCNVVKLLIDKLIYLGPISTGLLISCNSKIYESTVVLKGFVTIRGVLGCILKISFQNVFVLTFLFLFRK